MWKPCFRLADEEKSHRSAARPSGAERCAYGGGKGDAGRPEIPFRVGRQRKGGVRHMPEEKRKEYGEEAGRAASGG